MDNRQVGSMKKRKVYIGLIVASFLFLVFATIFSSLRADNPYMYFTGMGDSFDLSPDEQYYLFSYYIDGKENIYRTNVDGTFMKKITHSTSERFHSPRYSRDGKKILYLGKNAQGINKLYYAKQDGSGQKKLTHESMHVKEAVFSVSGEEIFFIGMPADEFKKAEGETTEGFDLYVVDTNSGKTTQLTDQDHFLMGHLSVSQDGKEVYYSLFTGASDKITAFSLEEGLEKEAPGANKLSKINSSFIYSPDRNKIAYTAVSEESWQSSKFEYDLFLLDLKNDRTIRLTDLDSAVVSPRFFEDQDRIVFLENTNWPDKPAQHTLKVVDLETKKIQSIAIDSSLPKSSNWLYRILDTFANKITVAILYVVLLGIISTYLAFFHSKKKSYLPAFVSFILSVLLLLSSFVVAFVGYPWYGIGLAILAASIVPCTLMVFIYTVVLNLFKKRG